MICSNASIACQHVRVLSEFDLTCIITFGYHNSSKYSVSCVVVPSGVGVTGVVVEW